MTVSQKIFVGGAPRSGTTMLASILGSHTQVLATSETQFKFDLAHLFSDKSIPEEVIFQKLKENKRFRIWNLNVDKDQLIYSDLPSFMESLVTQYGITADKKTFSHWVDVTPVNLRHAAFLDKMFPGCLFIHMIRDGRGVYASQKKVDFGSNDPIFASLKWLEAIALGLATESTFPNRSLRVYYENILRNPEAECRRICHFIGIEFENKMIDASEFKKTPYTFETHALVGNRPDPSRIEDWKTSLSKKEIRYFESMTYDLLDMLGYERMNQGILKKPDELAQSRIMMMGALKYLTLNKWRSRSRFKKNIK